MKAKWQDLGRRLGGYRCITIKSVTRYGVEYEDCLAGERGEIWDKGDGRYKAFLSISAVREKIFVFDSKDLKRQISRLKVGWPAEQLLWANGDKKRHD